MNTKTVLTHTGLLLALGLALGACAGSDIGDDFPAQGDETGDIGDAADDGATDDGATDDGATDDGVADGGSDDGSEPEPEPEPEPQPEPEPPMGDVVVGDVGFTWHSAGGVEGMECTHIFEASDPHTWNDNYFCASEDIGMVWSSAGPVADMICTQILEPSDVHTWSDNYLCLPEDSNFRFRWSWGGAPGSNSVQWLEESDPETWHDNFLQIVHTGFVCSGAQLEDNNDALLVCPGLCNAFGFQYAEQWSNDPLDVLDMGCNVYTEALCDCML